MADGKNPTSDDRQPERLSRRVYERELLRLQVELVKLQEWVRAEGVRLVVVFEGRDAAGKGSTIKRVTEKLNPRVARIVALPTPTERELFAMVYRRMTALAGPGAPDLDDLVQMAAEQVFQSLASFDGRSELLPTTGSIFRACAISASPAWLSPMSFLTEPRR